MPNSEIKIFQTEDGNTKIQVKLENLPAGRQGETVWLSQKQMAQLFDKNTDTINIHLKNIFSSGELIENSTTEESSDVKFGKNRNGIHQFCIIERITKHRI